MHCTAKTVMISDDLSSITYPVSLVFEGHTARHANLLTVIIKNLFV